MRTVLVSSVASVDAGAGIAIGVVRGEGEAVVAAEHGGRITALLVDVGDRVAKGQVLARLDPSAAQLRVRQAEAELRQAAAAAEARGRVAKRTAALHAEDAATDADLEAAEAEARSASAARDAAGAALEVARRDAAQNVLRAPVAGTIAARPARLGAVLAPGETAFALEGNGPRRIDAMLPADMAARLKPGARLAFRCPGGVGAARLIGISARSDGGGSGRAAVLAVIEGAPVPGSAVELTLPGDAAAGVRVPLAAVQQQRKGDTSVMLVGSDKRLRQLPVQLVTISGSSAVVRGKLAQGDLVVAAGAEFLEPGIPVRPQFAQR